MTLPPPATTLTNPYFPRYTRDADWDYVARLSEDANAAGLQVIGSGDVLSWPDYRARRAQCPAMAGIMLARGALIKPWLFTEVGQEGGGSEVEAWWWGVEAIGDGKSPVPPTPPTQHATRLRSRSAGTGIFPLANVWTCWPPFARMAWGTGARTHGAWRLPAASCWSGSVLPGATCPWGCWRCGLVWAVDRWGGWRVGEGVTQAHLLAEQARPAFPTPTRPPARPPQPPVHPSYFSTPARTPTIHSILVACQPAHAKPPFPHALPPANPTSALPAPARPPHLTPPLTHQPLHRSRPSAWGGARRRWPGGPTWRRCLRHQTRQTGLGSASACWARRRPALCSRPNTSPTRTRT